MNEFSWCMILQEIFSSWTHKTDHFQRIHRRTGVPYNSMLFFDDEDRNIEPVKPHTLYLPCLILRICIVVWNSIENWSELFGLFVIFSLCIVQVSKMGVTSILVGNGVNLGAFRQGLMEFSQNSGSSSGGKKKWEVLTCSFLTTIWDIEIALY